MKPPSQYITSSCLDDLDTAIAIQQTREDLRDGAVGRCVHDAQRMTDSVTIISSCSNSPRPMVRFLRLCIPNSPLEEVAPLRTSAALSSFSLILLPPQAEVSIDIKSFSKLEPATQNRKQLKLEFPNRVYYDLFVCIKYRGIDAMSG